MIRDMDENKSFLVRIEIFTTELTVSPNLLRRQTRLYHRKIEFLSTRKIEFLVFTSKNEEKITMEK